MRLGHAVDKFVIVAEYDSSEVQYCKCSRYFESDFNFSIQKQ